MAPATSADASCMPGNTGLSGVPSPNTGSAAAARTASMYRGSCTSSSWSWLAGDGAATVTPAPSSTPNARASAMVRSTRTGASGWPGPKS